MRKCLLEDGNVFKVVKETTHGLFVLPKVLRVTEGRVKTFDADWPEWYPWNKIKSSYYD